MKIRDVISEQQNPKLGDSFDIELGSLVIETGVIGFMPDGVIVEADEKTFALLNISGALLESVDNSLLTEAIWRRRSSYYNPSDYERDQQRQMDYGKREFKRQELQHELGHEDTPEFKAKMRDQDKGPWYIKVNGKILKTGGIVKAFEWKRQANNYALAILKNKPELEGKVLLTKKSEDDSSIAEGRMSEVDSIFADIADGTLDAYTVMTRPQGPEEEYVAEKLQDMYYDIASDYNLHPDDDFEQILDIVHNQLADDYGSTDFNEAKYQGREVPLGKPMAGDVKKSKVYVRGPKGNVVKVNFGDKKMKIKKSNPKRRKSFRARHRCDNPGPRWKARYWSCRAW